MGLELLGSHHSSYSFRWLGAAVALAQAVALALAVALAQAMALVGGRIDSWNRTCIRDHCGTAS